MFLVTNPEHSLMQAAMETTNFISATACTKIENLDLGTNIHNKWGPQQPRSALRITGFGLKGTLKNIDSQPQYYGQHTSTSPESHRIV